MSVREKRAQECGVGDFLDALMLGPEVASRISMPVRSHRLRHGELVLVNADTAAASGGSACPRGRQQQGAYIKHSAKPTAQLQQLSSFCLCRAP